VIGNLKAMGRQRLPNDALSLNLVFVNLW